MDFSILSDDQLLQLLKQAMQEALLRGGAVRVAAQQEVISAQERAEIEREVAAQILQKRTLEERARIEFEAKEKFEAEHKKAAAQKTESVWSAKAAIAAAIKEWGYDGFFELNIWSRGADRRVYFQLDRKGTWKFCLYLTGNAYHPPGDFEGEGADCWFDDKQAQLKNLLKAVAQHWSCDMDTSNQVGDVVPNEKRLQKYREILQIKEAASNVRSS